MIPVSQLQKNMLLKLEKANFKYPNEQVKFIIRHVLNFDPSFNKSALITKIQYNRCHTLCNKILSERIPIQHIIGYCWFMGLKLKVDKRVIVPDSATQLLVETAHKYILNRHFEDVRIVDVGTGNGAIAITLANFLPNSIVFASDMSFYACAIAQQNVNSHNLQDRIFIITGDTLLAWPESEIFNYIVTNPPYIPLNSYCYLPPEVLKHSPPKAIFAGQNGMDIYDKLLTQAPTRLHSGGLMFLEYCDEVHNILIDRIRASNRFNIVDNVKSKKKWGSVLILEKTN